VVEWLRSCYSSEWRLYRGSNQKTPGYYYFTPEDKIVHCPYVHNYGSLNWVTDDRGAKPDPPLGEVTPPAGILGRTWRNGAAPVQAVLPRIRGTADCLEYGARLSDPHPFQSSYGGVSTLDTPPAVLTFGPGLALWLKPESLNYGPEPHRLSRWIDSSGLVRDAVSLHPDLDPEVAIAGPGFPRKARCDNLKYLGFPPIIGLTSTYSIYMAGRVRPHAVISESSALSMTENIDRSQGTVYVTAELLRLDVGVDRVDMIIDTPVDEFGIWCWRRDGANVRLEWVGVQQLDQVLETQAERCGAIATVGSGTDNASIKDDIAEVLVFDRSLSDARHASIVAYMTARYL